MLAVISPAKTLDFDSACPPHSVSQPEFLAEASELVGVLRKMDLVELMNLMGISRDLASLNRQRYQEWKPPFTEDHSRAALFAFKGDVYTGFQLSQYSKADFQFAQKHLRILSGLYGVLKPLDLIQPHRLEMGTKLITRKGKDLYQFWGDTITQAIDQALRQSGSSHLINLASHEYFLSVREKKLAYPVVTPVFKDWKSGSYKIISFYAKKARGMMCDFMIRNRVTSPEVLKEFETGGYRFNPRMSEGSSWVFTRDGATSDL